MSLSGMDEFEKGQNRKKTLGKIADLLDKNNISVDDVARVEKININRWHALTKNADGEAEIHDMEGSSIRLSPKWETGPEWPVVAPAKPVLLKPPTAPKPRPGRHHQAVILPDPQIGFRRFEDGLQPFHSDAAMAAAVRVIVAVDPERVVNLGDFLDFPEWGKYLQERAFATTMQDALDRAHLFLAEQREAAPYAHIDLMEGNHDSRFTKAIIENAGAAFGIRKANLPKSWPVLSMQHLLRLDELAVDHTGGYPAGELWLNDHVRCIHGTKVNSRGSTASAVVNDAQCSTIFGHIHRIELQHKTNSTRTGPSRIFAASPGCLCRVDGAVPSVKGGLDVTGRPLRTWEDWQNGCAILSWYDDGPSNIEMVEIVDGRAWIRGALL